MGFVLLMLVTGLVIGGLVLLLAAGVAAGAGVWSGSSSTYARQRATWGGATLVIGLVLLGMLLMVNVMSGGNVLCFSGCG